MNINKLISIIIISFLLITSCTNNPKSKVPSTTNINESPKKDGFEIKSIPIDIDQDITIISKDSDIPITVTTTRTFPKNSSIKLDGLSIEPLKRVYEPLETITKKEAKNLKRAFKKPWRRWFRVFKHTLNSEMRSIYREQRKKDRDLFNLQKKSYQKGSLEYKKFVKNYHKEKKEKYKKFRKGIKDLKKSYKEVWQVVSDYSDNLYNRKQHKFQTKGFLGDLLTAVVSAVSPIVGTIIHVVTGKNPITTFAENIATNAYNQVPKVEEPEPTPPIIKEPIETLRLEPVSKKAPETKNIFKHQGPATEQQNRDIVKAIRELNNVEVPQIIIPITVQDVLRMVEPKLKERGLMWKPLSPNCINIPITDPKKIDSNCPDFFGFLSLRSGFSQDIDKDKETGKVTVSFKWAYEDGSISGFRDSLVRWLVTGQTSQLPEEQILEEVNAVLSKIPKLNLTLESEELCKQKVKVDFETGELVNFSAVMSNRLLFDGDYNYKVSFIEPLGDLPYLITGKINILKELKDDISQFKYNSSTEDRLLQVSSKNVFNSIGKDSQGRPINKEKFGFYFTNKRGNTFDMQLTRAWNESCPVLDSDKNNPEKLNACCPIYTANCVDISSGDMDFAKSAFETNLFRMQTQYNKYPNYKGINIDQGVPNTGFPYTDVLVTRINYSTFARVTEYPELAQINATFHNNSPNILFDSINGISGTNLYLSPKDENNNNIDEEEPEKRFISGEVPSSANGIHPRNILVIKETAEYLSNKENNYPKISNQGHNLFMDLAANQYQQFNNTEIKSCETVKFLNVGAVVDLTNDDGKYNQKLYNRGGRIPLALSVIDSTGKVVKRWSFDSKLGQVTIVQNYWDGKVDIEDFFDGKRDTTLPEYKVGNYKVVVDIDPDGFDSQRNNLIGKYTAVITEPYVSEASTDASINITNSSSCVSPIEGAEYSLEHVTLVNEVEDDGKTFVISGSPDHIQSEQYAFIDHNNSFTLSGLKTDGDNSFNTKNLGLIEGGKTIVRVGVKPFMVGLQQLIKTNIGKIAVGSVVGERGLKGIIAYNQLAGSDIELSPLEPNKQINIDISNTNKVSIGGIFKLSLSNSNAFKGGLAEHLVLKVIKNDFSSSVTLRIKDEKGLIVRSYKDNPITNHYTVVRQVWDFKDENGDSVPAGKTYTIEAAFGSSAQNVTNKKALSLGKIIIDEDSNNQEEFTRKAFIDRLACEKASDDPNRIKSQEGHHIIPENKSSGETLDIMKECNFEIHDSDLNGICLEERYHRRATVNNKRDENGNRTKINTYSEPIDQCIKDLNTNHDCEKIKKFIDYLKNRLKEGNNNYLNKNVLNMSKAKRDIAFDELSQRDQDYRDMCSDFKSNSFF